MLKKIREFFQKKDSEKGQGVVEYALVLGFVAVLAIYLLSGSDLTKDVQANIKNADNVATAVTKAYDNATKGTADTGHTTG